MDTRGCEFQPAESKLVFCSVMLLFFYTGLVLVSAVLRFVSATLDLVSAMLMFPVPCLVLFMPC